jgi:hypothetical protein
MDASNSVSIDAPTKGAGEGPRDTAALNSASIGKPMLIIAPLTGTPIGM